MSAKKVFFTLWDGEEFCGAFATREEARADRSDQLDPGQDFPGRFAIFREVDTLQRLEAVCDDDCSELWAKLEEAA